ncbi:MAG: TGS domain-containing protein, partial [Bacilli bacterium]|nr:TGS domain-containing protein [Bacilli bacterium]
EHGIASHWSYKEKGKSSSMQSTMEQKLQFFRSIIELKNTESNDEDFVDSVKEDVFKDTIYVFTPKGDVVELPNGSTPIDFAYRVHSEVGDKMVGAIINGNIVPLDYQLKDDDIIKININKNSVGPSKEWLNMAKTAQAKNKIKAFFNRNDKVTNLKRGEDLIAKELRKRKIAFNDFFTNENINKITDELKYTNLEEIYINVGNNKLPPSQLINIITNENESKEELILKKTLTREVTAPIIKNDIIVKGIDDIKVNVASCCKPVPGDRIVGYITKGYGITVHRMVCPNVRELEERIIDVMWNDTVVKKYPTTVLVNAISNDNLLLNIISKTSNSNVVVQNINAVNKSDTFLYEIVILVEHKENAIKFINDVKTIPNVISIERIIK